VAAVDVPGSALETILGLLNRHVPNREVRVMGSRATGAAKPFSDLDLVIMGDAPLPLRTLAELRDAFDDSDLPFTVDIVDWASTSDTFQRIINEQSRLLRPATPTPAPR
jgi:predicted nucleotidyltransferase